MTAPTSPYDALTFCTLGVNRTVDTIATFGRAPRWLRQPELLLGPTALGKVEALEKTMADTVTALAWLLDARTTATRGAAIDQYIAIE